MNISVLLERQVCLVVSTRQSTLSFSIVISLMLIAIFDTAIPPSFCRSGDTEIICILSQICLPFDCQVSSRLQRRDTHMPFDGPGLSCLPWTLEANRHIMQNFSLVSAIASSKQAPMHMLLKPPVNPDFWAYACTLGGRWVCTMGWFLFYNTPKGIATDLWTGQLNIQNSQPGSLQLLCDHSKAGDVSGPMSHHTVKQSTSSECCCLTVHLLQTADLNSVTH